MPSIVSAHEPLLDAATDDQKTLLSMEEVAQHASTEDCWLSLYGEAYDVTTFLAVHPGGPKILLSKAGTDVTESFERIHSRTLSELMEKFPGSIAWKGTVREYTG